MLTITSTNYNYPNYQPAFKATNIEQIRSNLKAMEKEITIQDQEVIQTKIAELKLGHKVAQFFRTLFTGVSINKNAVQHFRNKYGSFYLTKKGLEQYMKIMPQLLAAKANIRTLLFETYKTSSERNSIAENRSTVGICLSQLGLLKSFGEIDTTQGQQHKFKSRYGRFNLTDKGFEQYLETVSALEKAKGMVKSWRFKSGKWRDDRNNLATNRAIVRVCLSKLGLLKSFGEIDTTHGQQHKFKSKYGEFNLTDKGLDQYMNIVSDLEGARAVIKSWRFDTCKTSSVKSDIAENEATVGICLSQLGLLKSFGEIGTVQGKQYKFKSKYGRFNLTDKGLEQYMDIVSDLENAKAMVKSLRSERFKTTGEKNTISNGKVTIETCKYKLDILKQLGELPDNI